MKENASILYNSFVNSVISAFSLMCVDIFPLAFFNIKKADLYCKNQRIPYAKRKIISTYQNGIWYLCKNKFEK